MKRVYLHLGTHKTGTSFVQSALRRHSTELRDVGVRPIVGAESNAFLAGIDHDVIRNDWMNDESGVIVYSNENFILAENRARLDLVAELRKTIVDAGGTVTNVIYVRPAIEWIPSMWAQYVKIGSAKFGALSLDEFQEAFDYNSVLDAVVELQTDGDTIIRPYVRSSLKNQSILDDFLDTIGVAPDTIDASSLPATGNPTASRRQIELARAYNANRPSGASARNNHVQLLNSFLRSRVHRDDSPSVAATVTKAQLQTLADRYAVPEAALTNGSVDSRTLLPDHLASAPDVFRPDVPPDAVDQYLQNMMILSTIDKLREASEV